MYSKANKSNVLSRKAGSGVCLGCQPRCQCSVSHPECLGRIGGLLLMRLLKDSIHRGDYDYYHREPRGKSLL